MVALCMKKHFIIYCTYQYYLQIEIPVDLLFNDVAPQAFNDGVCCLLLMVDGRLTVCSAVLPVHSASPLSPNLHHFYTHTAEEPLAKHTTLKNTAHNYTEHADQTSTQMQNVLVLSEICKMISCFTMAIPFIPNTKLITVSTVSQINTVSVADVEHNCTHCTDNKLKYQCNSWQSQI